jgi:tetratricopeptide (TPR) repeat protein
MRIGLAALLLGICVWPVLAETGQNETWLLFEQGNAAYDEREFGEALKLYQEAVAKAGIFPEAEIGIGDIYAEEGELDLAISQYKKAYDLRKSFYIPGQQYEVLFRLADIYEKKELYKLMEDSLQLVIRDDVRFNETPTYRMKSQIAKNYADKGIDRMLFLYSFEDTIFAKAHSRLGLFYYRTGRYSPAIDHLLYSIIYRTARMKAFLFGKDAEYEFTSLADLMRRIDAAPELRRYAQDVGFFRDLYYLAGATFANGYPLNGKALWNLIAGSKAADSYADLSRRQAKKPWIEPLLEVDAKP